MTAWSVCCNLESVMGTVAIKCPSRSPWQMCQTCLFDNAVSKKGFPSRRHMVYGLCLSSNMAATKGEVYSILIRSSASGGV